MADIPETVLLSQAVCIGLTQPYSLSGRSRWFLSYIATVPHMNLYVESKLFTNSIHVYQNTIHST